MMDVCGKRVFVLGDSHCAALGPPLQEKLYAAGASDVHIIYQSGRSIYSFYRQRRIRAAIEKKIKRFKPDVAIIILGTNDIGYNLGIVKKLYRRLRNSLPMEVWAVGPPSLPRKYTIGAALVTKVMQDVFGSDRFVDSRPLTSRLSGRTPDGVHFTDAGADRWVERLATAFALSGKPRGCYKTIRLPTAASLLGFGLLFIINRRNQLMESD